MEKGPGNVAPPDFLPLERRLKRRHLHGMAFGRQCVQLLPQVQLDKSQGQGSELRRQVETQGKEAVSLAHEGSGNAR